jgi:indole-3-glycerol phosphate synthase
VNKRRELAALSLPSTAPKYSPRPVVLRVPGEVRLITEIKRRSPSAGPLSTTLSVGERARCYSDHGAALISILCDTLFFDGSYQHLSEARESCDTPLLCKEFILDERQLDFARAFGADAVLLIVRCLNDEELPRLVKAAQERDLLPLVEVFGEEEADRALAAGASLIGVNSRDLDTLEMDAARATRVLQSLPQSVTRAHLSGVKRPEDIRQLRHAGVEAALLGEVLMRQEDPGALLAQLISAGRD